MRSLKLPVLIKKSIEDSTGETKIIAPDLEYAFYVPNANDVTLNLVKNKLMDYLIANPHKLNADGSWSQDHWKIKNDNRYVTQWLQSNIDGTDVGGVLIELDTNNQSAEFQYFATIFIITVLFHLNVASWAYYDTLITFVNLPDVNANKTTDLVLAQFNAANDCFQSAIGYFAMNTPQYIDFISRKIVRACQKKEYDLSDDFEVESTKQIILTSLANHPLKIISISLISLVLISSTLFGAVMSNIVAYEQTKLFLTKAHDMKMSNMDLQTLILSGTATYMIGVVFGFFIQFEMFAQATKAAASVYEALSNKMSGCKNRMTCPNPFRLFSSDAATESAGVNERFIPSIA